MDKIKYDLLQECLNTCLAELEREPGIPMMFISNKWVPVCGEVLAQEICRLYHMGIRVRIIQIKTEIEALND